jgi:hypothetical protein
MKFQELTVKLCNANTMHPTETTISVPREVGDELFNLLWLLNWYYGPDMTVRKLTELLKK